MPAPKRWLGLHLIGGAAIEQEDGLMAPPIGISSLRVAVGAEIIIKETPKVDVLTAV